MKKKELEIATTTYTVAYKKGYTQCQEDMANDINRKLDLLIGICEKRISDCVVNKLNILEIDTQGMLFAYQTFKQYINKQD